MTGLGRLERVRTITSVWPHEARDFTPWLASEEVIGLLSASIGYGTDGLDVIGTEQSVGGFKADIICRETAPPGRLVVIENQFGTTNHDHLGKLLTYAAGQDAKVLILLAEEIREEHEAALDLLNTMSSDEFEVFGVEIELWRIGDSPAAPRFNVVSKPNDWKRHEKRRIASSNETSPRSPTQTLQVAFWQGLREVLEGCSPPFNPVSPMPANWISHGIGRAGVGLNMSMHTRDNWVRVEVYLSGETGKGYFHQLNENKTEIERAVGHALEWQLLPGKLDSRICLTKSVSDLSERSSWPEIHQWLAQTAISFHGAFHSHVRALDRDAAKGVA